MRHGKAKSDLFHQHGAEDHDEELWLVSYADMVTLLFGFFVILFSFSTLDDKKFDQMTEKVAEAFKSDEKKKTSDSDVGVTGEERQLRAMQMLISMLNLGENIDEAVAKIEKTYAEAGTEAAAKRVILDKVAADHRDLVSAAKNDEAYHTVELVLPDASLFNAGSFELNSQAVKKLKALAKDLQHVPNLVQIEVTGHTDSRPPNARSHYQNNFTLSSLRAGAVAQVFLNAGISPKQMSVRGQGSLKPVLPERGPEGQFLVNNMAKNRRVTILLKLRDKYDPLVH